MTTATGARFMSSSVGEHGDSAEVSAPRPAACFGNCGECGTKLVPDGCPQLLPCLHSLCHKCVCVDRSECPVCGAAYTPTEVIDNLFFKKFQQTTQCGGCGGAGAGGWCVECGEALCPECVSAHKRVKVTREHTVLAQRPLTVSAPTLYCSLHREERVKLICQLCDQATCRECQLTFHRNHRFQFLHEAVAEEKGQISSLMEDLRLQRQEVRKSLSDLDKRLLDVKDLQNKLNRELRDTILSIRDALLRRAMTLAGEVQEQCCSEKRSMLERQEVLKKLEGRQTYLLSFTERALDTEGYSTLLSCRRKIQSQLLDVMSHAVSPGDYMMNLTFHCAQDIYGHMATFGKVVVEKVPFACTNNENSISKNPHLNKNQTLNSQGFFTTQTPPTSSPNPPTYCDNSLTSSHNSTASAYNLLSASFQTSRTLNSNTSTHNFTTYCHNHPTLSSSKIQMPYSHISTTSSGNPPTSSLNPPTSSLNPPTSSLNPPTSCGNPPTSSLNPPTSSLNPPTSFGNPPTSCGNAPTSSLNPPTSSLSPPTYSLNPPTSCGNPPTSSLNPPTSSLNHPTSSLNPPASSLSPPASSLSPPTSSLSPLTSFGNLPTSFGNPPTSSLSPPTSSGNPPTSSLNPPTSSLNCPTSSLNPPASSLSPPTSSGNRLTSSLNPPTYSLNPPTSSLNPPASSLSPPTSSLSPPTSSLNPPTSSLNPPTSSLNPPTYSLNAHTSSLNPPTSSLNPHTSSLNPPTSSGNARSLSQMLYPSSYRRIRSLPPADSHTAISPCQGIAIYNPNLSSQTLTLPYLLSTSPLSLPVTLYSVSLNTVPMMPIPLTPNGQMANANTPAMQTAVNSPCSQTSLTVAQAAILPEAQGLCESMPLDKVVGLASSTKDQTANGTCLAPPVKALADSPCERAPPAGDEQEKPVSQAAAENEPTSTMVEADIAECTRDPSEEATPTSDTGSASEIASPRANDDSSVNGLSVSSLDSAGVDLQMPACSPGNTGLNPRNPTKFMLGDQSDLFRCPVTEDDEDDKETNIANEGDDQEHNKGDGRPALVPRLKALADFLAQRASPTGRKKRANPAAGDTWCTSPMVETDGAKTCAEVIVEVAQKTGADSASKTDCRNDMDRRIDDSAETEGSDTKSLQEPREAEKRPLVPRVSLVRLPVSFPPPGGPLPQFRLVPRANKQEVHLEQIPEKDQSAVRAAIQLSLPPKPPRARKVRCAVCHKAGELRQCTVCGMSFHTECHFTPIATTDSDNWQCMVCEDQWEVKVHQSRVSGQDPGLGLPDQRKCKRLFLTLISQKHSTLLYRQPELLSPSSRYVDITLIRDRLLQKLSPAYLPSEFVSDIWLLLNSLQNSPKDIKHVAKLQRTFRKGLRKAFGSSLHPSLLEPPLGKKVKGAAGGAEPQGAEEARQMKKRKRKEESVRVEPSMKKLCMDEERAGGME